MVCQVWVTGLDPQKVFRLELHKIRRSDQMEVGAGNHPHHQSSKGI